MAFIFQPMVVRDGQGLTLIQMRPHVRLGVIELTKIMDYVLSSLRKILLGGKFGQMNLLI